MGSLVFASLSNFLISFNIYGTGGISSLFSLYQGEWKSPDFMSRQLYQLCISREFIREERDLLLEEVYIIKNYCDEIMASSLGEGLS